jgi:hypothetical protein
MSPLEAETAIGSTRGQKENLVDLAEDQRIPFY